MREPQALFAPGRKAGKARVIVITNSVADDDEWQATAYEQLLRDDMPEDAVYDNLR